MPLPDEERLDVGEHVDQVFEIHLILWNSFFFFLKKKEAKLKWTINATENIVDELQLIMHTFLNKRILLLCMKSK